MRKLCTLMLAGGLAVSLAACDYSETTRNMWKGTKSLYYEYLNTPAKLTMEDIKSYSEHELYLGEAMSFVAEELGQLIRLMEDSDRGPDNAWAAAAFQRFPWLGGLAITDGDGTPLVRIPEYSLKEFDASALVPEDPRQKRSSLRAGVVNSPLGPEVYLAKPIYVENQLRALVITHFDPRALLANHPKYAAMAMLSPDTVLWPGIYRYDATPLAGTDWAAKIKDDVSGSVSNAAGRFYWSSMYFANLPLVFALPQEGEFPTSQEQLEQLEMGSAFSGLTNMNVVPGAQSVPGSGVSSESLAPDPYTQSAPEENGGTGAGEATESAWPDPSAEEQYREDLSRSGAGDAAPGEVAQGEVAESAPAAWSIPDQEAPAEGAAYQPEPLYGSPDDSAMLIYGEGSE